MEVLTEQELVRREKMNKLIQRNDPFGSRFDVTSNSMEIKKNMANFLTKN